MTGPLRRHQVTLLKRLQALGACTDDSLSTAIGCDRTAIVHYRAGRREAPLGLLGAALAHLDDGEALELLDIYAREHGGRVVPDPDSEPLPLAEATRTATAAVGAALVAASGVQSPTTLAGLASHMAGALEAVESARDALDELARSIRAGRTA